MSGGTGAIQQRNTELVDILSTDFIRRNEATVAWGKAVGMHQMLPGLRGFWPMSSSDETGAAFDLSGQGRTLAYNGNPLYSVENLHPGIALDGTGDYLSRADENGLDITGTDATIAAALRGLTLGGWFTFDAFDNDAGLIQKLNNGADSYGLFESTTGTNHAYMQINGDSLSSGALVTGQWYHIIMRFTPSTQYGIFVNGTWVTSAAGVDASMSHATASDLYFGRWSTNYFQGWMSLCFLCAAALPDRVIQALYQHSRTLFGV